MREAVRNEQKHTQKERQKTQRREICNSKAQRDTHVRIEGKRRILCASEHQHLPIIPVYERRPGGQGRQIRQDIKILVLLLHSKGTALSNCGEVTNLVVFWLGLGQLERCARV